MAYQANIPQATDKLRISQSDLLNNFIAIDAFVDINHYGFASGNVGKHLYLQMPETAAPATAANEAGLYAANGATSGATELVFRRESNGSSIAFTEAVFAASGWTRLPSGILLQWGSGTIDNTGADTINFPVAFPTACLNVQLTPKVPAAPPQQNFIQVVSFTTAHFVVKSYDELAALSQSDCYFFAIGY